MKYENNLVKIGEDVNLNLVSFQKYHQALKKGLLSPVEGAVSPEAYARHSSEFRFRFPFPDEDRLGFADIGDFSKDRGIRLKIKPGTDSRFAEQLMLMAGKDNVLEITHQKLVYMNPDRKFSLVLVVRNPESGHSFRIEDETVIPKLNRSIIRNYIIRETDQMKKQFYRSVMARILQGYRREIPVKLTNYRSQKKHWSIAQKGKRLI